MISTDDGRGQNPGCRCNRDNFSLKSVLLAICLQSFEANSKHVSGFNIYNYPKSVLISRFVSLICNVPYRFCFSYFCFLHAYFA